MDKRLRHLASLRYFEAAARLQSYSKAGQELFVSQAAVSQTLRKLEEELGCTLFVRKGRSMVLTPRGETLYRYLSKGFESIITGLNTIQNEPIDGILKVSSPPSFASRWLLPRLWKFSADYPNIQIRIITNCDTLDLEHGEIDVAIWQGKKDVDESALTKDLLLEEPIFPYCSPELAKSMRFTDPQQLLNCWLIHYGNDSFHWRHWFNSQALPMQKEAIQWMEVGTFDMAISAVLAGHGVCLASDCLTQDLVKQGALVKPFDMGMLPGLQFHLYVAQESPRRERIQLFSEWLKQEIKSNEIDAWSDRLAQVRN